MELHLKTCSTDGEPPSNPTRYCQLVGGLVYLTISRANIAHVYVLSRLSVCLVRLVVFLAIYGELITLLFSTTALELCAYIDANWADDPIDRSTYCTAVLRILHYLRGTSCSFVFYYFCTGAGLMIQLIGAPLLAFVYFLVISCNLKEQETR